MTGVERERMVNTEKMHVANAMPAKPASYVQTKLKNALHPSFPFLG